MDLLALNRIGEMHREATQRRARGGVRGARVGVHGAFFFFFTSRSRLSRARSSVGARRRVAQGGRTNEPNRRDVNGFFPRRFFGDEGLFRGRRAIVGRCERGTSEAKRRNRSKGEVSQVDEDGVVAQELGLGEDVAVFLRRP